MSKIGRKPINIGNVAVEIKGQEVHYKGKKSSGVHILPDILVVRLIEKNIVLTPQRKTNETNKVWGLHRALLANAIIGADVGFEKQLRIIGLGFKAIAKGNQLQFSLGYSHKIDFPLAEEVAVEIDKTGQLLTFKSYDKNILGLVCSKIRALRSPEPYKGTGIQYVGEVIIRKTGKAKAS
ncbi:MAG: 50S ribosomal protein L6 [Candidatus Babeliaceae bacterium]|jgi:large subunit ribosomal protein L6